MVGVATARGTVLKVAASEKLRALSSEHHKGQHGKVPLAKAHTCCSPGPCMRTLPSFLAWTPAALLS